MALTRILLPLFAKKEKKKKKENKYMLLDKYYHTLGTVPKSNKNITESDKIDILNTQIHDRSLSWLGTGTSIKSGRVKLVLLAYTSTISEMMLSCKCLQCASEIPTLAYNRANKIITCIIKVSTIIMTQNFDICKILILYMFIMLVALYNHPQKLCFFLSQREKVICHIQNTGM
jgi:hypothetical protein